MITIYGANDDLVEVSGCVGEDEFYAGGDRSNWHADLIAPGDGPGRRERLRVHAAWERNGCWSVGACPVDEGVPLPGWPVTIRAARPGSDETPYSAVLEIDAPEGTRIANVHPAPGNSE